MTNEHLAPAFWPHPSLKKYWESGLHFQEGGTQPWVQALLYQLCRALDVRRAVELGCYLGSTSAWLALAIESNGGGNLTLVDTNTGYLTKATDRVSDLGLSGVTMSYIKQPTLEYLPEIPANTQFIFIDDDKAKVVQKVKEIRSRGCRGLIAVHDAESIPSEIIELNGFVLGTPVLHGSGLLALIGTDTTIPQGA